jgi:hypothetical protein
MPTHPTSAIFAGTFPPEFPMPEPHPGTQKPQSVMPPVPVIYETSELENMSLRVYAAIHLRVPDSGVTWLDDMIRRSRRLDTQPALARRRR